MKTCGKIAAVFDVIVGKNINSSLSAELEVAYAKHKFSRSINEVHSDEDGAHHLLYNLKSNNSSLSSFVNANYKFNNISNAIIPYVTAGVGFSSNKMGKISYSTNPSSSNFNGKSNTTNNFAWQVGVGALIPVQENISLNLACKYRNLGKVSSAKYVTDASGESHDGLRIKGRMRTLNLMAGVTFSL